MRTLRNGSLAGVALVSLLAVGSTGCQNKLHDENQALWQQNRELQSEKDRLEAELAGRPDAGQLSAVQSQMQQEIAARDAKIAELENQLKQPAAGQTQPELAGIETSFNQATGELTVNLPGDVLFDSGKAALKDSSKATLNKVVGALKKDYAGKKVIVIGHTDTDPISKTKDQWEDNLDLSAARARTVGQYLTGQGIANNLVGTRAYGPTQPRGNKAASRRVEIVVATR